MGNRKFRLSDMIPNAWFYKLKEMGKDKPSRNPPPPKKPHPPPSQTPPATTGATKAELPHPDSLSHTRKSYYFTRELNPKTTPKSSGSSELLFPNLDPPRKSSRKRRPTTKKRPTPITITTKCSSSSSSVSAGIHSFREKPGSPPLPESTTTTSSSPNHLFSLQNSSISGDGTCIVIDVDMKSSGRRKTEDPVSISRLELPRIRTDRKKFNDLVKQVGGALESIDEPIKQKKSSVKSRDTGANEFLSVKVSRDDSIASSTFKEQGNRPVRRFPTGSPRFRVRINSPRLAKRAQMNSSRRSISSSSSRKSISLDSLAVVKSSFDPKRDFRDSMVEMIVENNIRAMKDLEELLACYLSLNSDEYHDVIIQVFRQIWFDLNDNRGVREVVA